MHPALNHATNPARIAELHRQAQQRRDAALAGPRPSRLVAALLRGMRAPTWPRRSTRAAAEQPAVSPSG